MKILISGAIANFSGLSSQQLIEYLEENTEGLQFFYFQSRPGYVSSSAFDWKIVGDVSSILGIASFLWEAYSKLIKPHVESKSDSGIVIKIENTGNNNQIWIGNSINSKEELIRIVNQELNKVAPNISKVENQIKEIKESSNWKEKNNQ